MARTLIIATILWPLVLGATVLADTHGGSSRWPVVVRLAASRVCHQRPDRSFHTAGIQWPVCARCSGLYLGGAIGALVAGAQLRRRREVSRDRLLKGLALAALPTILTVALEWPRLLPVSNEARFIAAIPLGAAIAWVLASLAAYPQRTRT